MEGYVLVDNGCLTEKEARMNMEQCADFLARMIQKYGPEILDDITSEKDGISFVLVYKLSRFGRNAADVLKSMQLLMDYDVDLVCVEDSIDSSTQGVRQRYGRDEE